MKYCSTVHVTIIRDVDCDDCQVISVEMGIELFYTVCVCVCVCVRVGWRWKMVREGESARFCQTRNPMEKA